ncbi:MAG: polyprenyl synthetase family protein [Gammaproteobacteria bacterium]|nr:polyprenyl synthetase family protein [Gammaproteobacteria bacterium]
MTFQERTAGYIDRVEKTLADAIPGPDTPPVHLHKAMRYSVLGSGKRIRPLLVYAAGEALGVEPDLLDAPAAAIEMMHAFSLVHDDLPAMDNDNLRRGRPTTHRAFDVATAILAADALQPLAFQILTDTPALRAYPETQNRLIALLAEACGSAGMTGGQAIDMAAEGHRLEQDSLEQMYRLKTGRLLRASVLSAACCPPPSDQRTLQCLESFIDSLGLAYQIRDDILDIEGATDQIGKTQGADLAHDKATFPVLFGMDAARKRATELLETALHALDGLTDPAEGLRWLAQLTVLRKA